MSGEYILTWTGRRVEVYQFDDSATDPAAPPGPPVLLGAFDHKCTCAAIYSEGLFLGIQGRLECVNFSGSVLATLPFADAEGTPIAIHVAGRTVSDKRKQVFLAAGTDKGFIKVRVCVWCVQQDGAACIANRTDWMLMAPSSPIAC